MIQADIKCTAPRSAKIIETNIGSGALPSNMQLVRNIENDKIYAYFRSGQDK